MMSRFLIRLKDLFARRNVRIAAVVVSLAIVMAVAGALSSAPKDEPSSRIEPIPITDFDRALELAQSGETSEALGVVERHLATNAGDDRAGRLRDDLRRRLSLTADPPSADPGVDPDPDVTPPPTPDVKPDPGTDWNAPVSDLAILMPSYIEGLVGGSPNRDKTDIVLPYDPLPTGPYAETMLRVLVQVHDRGTAAAAARFRDEVSKVVYPDSAATVTVDGATGYFGTDGVSLATVSYARGRFVFEVVITAVESPASLKSAAVNIAKSFPDSYK